MFVSFTLFGDDAGIPAPLAATACPPLAKEEMNPRLIMIRKTVFFMTVILFNHGEVRKLPMGTAPGMGIPPQKRRQQTP